MGRIKIKDLPPNIEISEEEMRRMKGSGLVSLGSYADPRMYNCIPTCGIQPCVGFANACTINGPIVSCYGGTDPQK